MGAKQPVALIGWSLPMMEAADRLNRPFVVVGPPSCESYARRYDIPFVGWDFERLNNEIPMEQRLEHAGELYDRLKEYGVRLAIPLFEETVEWAGAERDVQRGSASLLPFAFVPSQGQNEAEGVDRGPQRGRI